MVNFYPPPPRGTRIRVQLRKQPLFFFLLDKTWHEDLELPANSAF